LFDGIDPLSQLRDIHEPASSLWPWVIACVAISVVILLLVGWLRARRAADPRRAALRELADLRRRSAESDVGSASVAEVATLLRRFALGQFPRSGVAGLCGRPWLEFLDRKCDSRDFVEGVGECLVWAPYAREAHVDVASLIELSESLVVSEGEPELPRGIRNRGTFDVVGKALKFRTFALARWRVRTACRANDARAARAALLHWAQLVWPVAPPRGLQALAAHLDDEALADALVELDGSLYATNAPTWHGGLLWRRVGPALRHTPRKHRSRNVLPQLYA